jgi:hypothetical protein
LLRRGSNVCLGEDADEMVFVVDDWQTPNLMARHQPQRL